MYLKILINNIEKCCVGDDDLLSLSASIVMGKDGPMGLMVIGIVGADKKEDRGRLWLDEEVLLDDIIEFNILDSSSYSSPQINLLNTTHVISYNEISVDIEKNDIQLCKAEMDDCDQLQVSLEYMAMEGGWWLEIDSFYDKPGSELIKNNILHEDACVGDKFVLKVSGEELKELKVPE